jgi:hypothetical protein
MSANQTGSARTRLLGGFPFISRTFEGRFRDNPYVLDANANLYIGPADQSARDEHVAIEIIFHFLNQTERPIVVLRELLRDRTHVLEAFAVFDDARIASDGDEFHIFLFGTYDGEPLTPIGDDELPSGPCGGSVNDVKRRFYELSSRLDPHFYDRALSAEQQGVEARFLRPSPASQGLGEGWLPT